MMSSRWWRGAAAMVFMVALGWVPGAPASASAGPSVSALRALPPVPGAEQSRAALAALRTAPAGPMAGYVRDSFPHWSIISGKCDTRETVLVRDGLDVVTDDQCRAVSGVWVSVYDGKVATSAAAVDADHLVPLGNAYRSGAAEWPLSLRKSYANDVRHIVAVSAASNRAKADRGPEAWKPPLAGQWCDYARQWIAAKAEPEYRLSVTAAERAALAAMLDTCPVPETVIPRPRG